MHICVYACVFVWEGGEESRWYVFCHQFCTIFNWSGSNSLTIVVSLCLSYFWTWISLFPSWLMIDLTFRPSIVSSRNSSSRLKTIDEFFIVEFDDNTNFPSSFLVSSTTGVAVLPNVRFTMPTPVEKQTIFLNVFPGIGNINKLRRRTRLRELKITTSTE